MKLRAAQQSPRVDDTGAICWYEGDTFEFDLQFTLKDEDGASVEMPADAQIEVIFFDSQGREVHSITQFGNTVTVAVDEVVTQKFKRGCYRYDAVLFGDHRTTLMKRNRVIVE